jgi:FkbM family methyltransferase
VKMRLNLFLRKNSKNEFDDLAFIYKSINRIPKHIFDCGANIGFVSYQFYKKFGTSKIHSFEPHVEVFDQMVKTLKDESANFVFNNAGISDVSGNLAFYKNNKSVTSSFLEPNDFHLSNMAGKYQKIDVPILSIQEYCTKNNISEIEILKLDIEGFELKALQGCKDLLANQKIDFVYAEVNFVPTYKDQPLLEDIILYMRQNNYYPYNFYGVNENIQRQVSVTNILFISNKVAKEINEKLGKNEVFEY